MKKKKHNKKNILQNKFVAISLVVILLIAFTLFVISMVSKLPGINSEKTVRFETNYGNIDILLYDDMPITTGNFEKLVNEGFYDGVIFHRVISNFMIQGGDPTGTGAGGPGYSIKDEFSEEHSNIRGTIAMANRGPNTGGSQFFINLVDNSYLDFNKPPISSKHPVFGEIVSGMEVVDKIANVDTNAADKPLEDVVILKAYLL